jgi:Dolichyl-phosphate-mannose-protein mannosyltransferase
MKYFRAAGVTRMHATMNETMQGTPTSGGLILPRLRLYAIYGLTAVVLLVILGYSAHATPAKYFIFPPQIPGVLYGMLVGLVCLLAMATVSLQSEPTGDSQHLGNRRYLLAAVVVGCIVPVFIAFVVLDRFMNSGDEYNYVFIADTLAHGRLYWPAAPVEGVFSSFWFIERDGKWVSMFPPGWPALLAIGGKLGSPYWLLNPLLGMVSILLVYLLGKKTVSPQTGLAAAAVYAISLFYLFNSGSYFAHIACVTFLLGFALCVVQAEEGRHWLWLVLAGLCVAIAFTTRYYPVVLVFGAFTVHTVLRRRALATLPWLFLGAAPIAVLFLMYNYMVFGHAFSIGHHWQQEMPIGLRLNLLLGLRVTVVRVLELLNWTSPVFLLLYAAALIYLLRLKSLRFYDYFFPVVVFGFAFFLISGGNRYGPRYLFDAYPFMVLTTVAGVDAFVTHHAGFWARFARHGLWVTCLYSVCAFPFVSLHFNRIVTERQDLYRLVQEMRLHNAVVIVESSTSPLWPMLIKDLTRNPPTLQAPVLYARNTTIDQLQGLFSDRSIWAYERDKQAVSGRLIRLDRPERSP